MRIEDVETRRFELARGRTVANGQPARSPTPTLTPVLFGANAFAVEADGEWDIFQARNCALAAPNEYVLSGLLRGCLATAHAMQAPHPAGARIVLLDSRLGRIDVGGHEWGEGLLIICPPVGSADKDPRAASATVTLPHAAAPPWAPRHVRGTKQASGDIALCWARCARVGGDSWGPGEPPLADGPGAYLLDILDGGDPMRSVTLSTPDYIYTAAQQTADFGGGVTSLRVRVAQLDSRQAPGLNTEATLSL